MKPLVIYHADCTDGFGAAFAAWLKLGDEAEYVPCQYGEYLSKQQIDFADREIYILDFSFPKDAMDVLFTQAKRVVWLDHHKTAFEMWCGKYEKGCTYTEKSYQGLHCILLNDNKSGAMLAWEYFHPGTSVPMLIQHIDDRDRWQFKIEGSKELHAYLASVKPWSFKTWRVYCNAVHSIDHVYFSEGEAILRAQDAHVKGMCEQARKCVILAKGTKELMDLHHGRCLFPGLAVNATIHMSEVGHELANSSGTFGLVYYIGADNKVKCSLRSNGDYDVSAMARAFGGGGHRNAAGFETDVETLMRWLK
jgi:oligoribonuclease NrnB/cAMP/cGMP phosphodiesterase (DHH superfamily)